MPTYKTCNKHQDAELECITVASPLRGLVIIPICRMVRHNSLRHGMPNARSVDAMNKPERLRCSKLGLLGAPCHELHFTQNKAATRGVAGKTEALVLNSCPTLTMLLVVFLVSMILPVQRGMQQPQHCRLSDHPLELQEQQAVVIHNPAFYIACI